MFNTKMSMNRLSMHYAAEATVNCLLKWVPSDKLFCVNIIQFENQMQTNPNEKFIVT